MPKPFRLFLRSAIAAVLTTIGASSTASVNFLKPGLEAYFPFAGNANDETGNGNHGTATGVTLVADRFGRPSQAYSFSGTTSSESNIKVTGTKLDLDAPRSVAFWMKLRQGTEGPRVFSTAGYEIATTVAFGAPYSVNMNTATQTGADGFDSPRIIPHNEWAHVAAVWTRTNGSLYVNGALAGSKTWNSPVAPDFSRGFAPEFGGNSGNAFDAFGGELDDIRIYSRALAPVEIRELYRYEKVEQSLVISQTAAATAEVINGFVVAVNVTHAGSGYDQVPAIRLSGGGGEGARAVATLADGRVSAITVQNAGQGYSSTPTVIIDSPPILPRRALAAAEVQDGVISRLIVLDSGHGYTEPPPIIISDSTGQGAEAVAELSSGQVIGAMLTSPGSGYSGEPVVRIASPPFTPWLSIGVSRVRVAMNVVLGRK